jgi:hypothetical protein
MIIANRYTQNNASIQRVGGRQIVGMDFDIVNGDARAEKGVVSLSRLCFGKGGPATKKDMKFTIVDSETVLLTRG